GVSKLGPQCIGFCVFLPAQIRRVFQGFKLPSIAGRLWGSMSLPRLPVPRSRTPAVNREPPLHTTFDINRSICHKRSSFGYLLLRLPIFEYFAELRPHFWFMPRVRRVPEIAQRRSAVAAEHCR